jgi:transglutaminase-like putative cysteine protease
MNPALRLLAITWLTAAFVLVAAPHVERLPPWLSVLAGVLCAWRVWLARTHGALPSRWLMGVIVSGAVAAIFLHYRTLFGRDAGVALLVLMMAMKFMESRTRRDGMILAFIGYFLVITNFFYSQSIPVALYLLACTLVLTAAMVVLQYEQYGQYASAAPAPHTQLKLAGVLLAQSLPLMLVLFLLFPRFQGPLWGMPSDAFAGVTGLSETMSPGTLNKLVFSEDVAFRAEFQGPVPPPNRLYWRGPVLWDFDGHTWHMSPFAASSGRNRIDLARRDNSVRYTVTLEPHPRRWLFALDMAGALPSRAVVTPDHLLLHAAPVTSRLRYEMISHLDYSNSDATEGQLRRALMLPAGFNPRTRELGASLRDRHGNADAMLRAALQYLRDQKFTYTLEPPLLARDTADDFLFNTRAGFCEHYASAFVILMRAAGVPARVVTGYQGGEFNVLGNYLIVRQSDAHAWTEVWLGERGWVRVDPTNSVSPARVESGLAASVPAGALLPRALRGERGALMHQIALAWDSVANAWNQTVLGFNLESQRALLYRAGLTGDTLRTLAVLLLVATALVTALLAFATLRNRARQRDPALEIYREFCARLARAGLPRNASEGPVDYARRVAAALPEHALPVQTITQAYVALRYASDDGVDAMRYLRRSVRAFAP